MKLILEGPSESHLHRMRVSCRDLGLPGTYIGTIRDEMAYHSDYFGTVEILDSFLFFNLFIITLIQKEVEPSATRLYRTKFVYGKL